MTKPTSKYLGGLAIFASAFGFYLSTVVIRWSQAKVMISSSYFVFARFMLGFLVVCSVMAYRRHPPLPHHYHQLIGRTVANCVAVYCFYKFVKHTSVAEANILNMTYPVFVALLGPLVAGEPSLAMAGWVGAILLFSANAMLAIRRGPQA